MTSSRSRGWLRIHQNKIGGRAQRRYFLFESQRHCLRYYARGFPEQPMDERGAIHLHSTSTITPVGSNRWKLCADHKQPQSVVIAEAANSSECAEWIESIRSSINTLILEYLSKLTRDLEVRDELLRAYRWCACSPRIPPSTLKKGALMTQRQYNDCKFCKEKGIRKKQNCTSCGQVFCQRCCFKRPAPRAFWSGRNAKSMKMCWNCVMVWTVFVDGVENSQPAVNSILSLLDVAPVQNNRMSASPLLKSKRVSASMTNMRRGNIGGHRRGVSAGGGFGSPGGGFGSLQRSPSAFGSFNRSSSASMSARNLRSAMSPGGTRNRGASAGVISLGRKQQPQMGLICPKCHQQFGGLSKLTEHVPKCTGVASPRAQPTSTAPQPTDAAPMTSQNPFDRGLQQTQHQQHQPLQQQQQQPPPQQQQQQQQPLPQPTPAVIEEADEEEEEEEQPAAFTGVTFGMDDSDSSSDSGSESGSSMGSSRSSSSEDISDARRSTVEDAKRQLLRQQKEIEERTRRELEEQQRQLMQTLEREKKMQEQQQQRDKERLHEQLLKQRTKMDQRGRSDIAATGAFMCPECMMRFGSSEDLHTHYTQCSKSPRSPGHPMNRMSRPQRPQRARSSHGDEGLTREHAARVKQQALEQQLQQEQLEKQHLQLLQQQQSKQFEAQQQQLKQQMEKERLKMAQQLQEQVQHHRGVAAREQKQNLERLQKRWQQEKTLLVKEIKRCRATINDYKVEYKQMVASKDAEIANAMRQVQEEQQKAFQMQADAETEMRRLKEELAEAKDKLEVYEVEKMAKDQIEAIRSVVQWRRVDISRYQPARDLPLKKSHTIAQQLALWTNDPQRIAAFHKWAKAVMNPRRRRDPRQQLGLSVSKLDPRATQGFLTVVFPSLIFEGRMQAEVHYRQSQDQEHQIPAVKDLPPWRHGCLMDLRFRAIV